MVFLRTILGALLSAVTALVIFRVLPYAPDLSDWGGRAFPRSYILPLLVVAVVSYVSAWIWARLSPVTGRLCGMIGMILAAIAAIGWDTGSRVLEPLFHHPAYPVFSDHALLALAILLVGGHLGGLRVEKTSRQVRRERPKAIE